MTTSAPRRRVLRNKNSVARLEWQESQVRRRQGQLAKERADLNRWMIRLKRAFHAMEIHQARISRIERQLSWLNKG